jgi:ADP-ribose pyrophosphatase YjhB (NUDIX family)
MDEQFIQFMHIHAISCAMSTLTFLLSIVILKGEELFLVRGKQSGLWQLPGGMIEANTGGFNWP